MKANRKKMYTMTGFALAMIGLPALLAADKAKPSGNPADVLKTMTEASRPGPEHAKLQPLVGQWSYTSSFWMDPNQPPITTTGTIERKWILGGRFLEEKVAGTGFDGQPGFEAFGLLGYDNQQKKYTATWACSMGTGTHTGLGTADPSGHFTYRTTCNCPILKTTVHGRDEVRIENPDRIVTQSYKVIDGKEVKMMELVSIRQR